MVFPDTGVNESDEQLYQRVLLRKDKDAFRLLFEKYRPALMDFINKLVHNADDAEELMMDAFAVVLSGKSRYKGKDGASLKTWLFAIARHQALQFLRKNKKRFDLDAGSYDEAVEIVDPAANEETPERQKLKSDMYRALYRALDSLDTEQRMALYLSYFEEMGAEEIAKVMKKSVKQVYNLSARGKGKLKTILEGEGYSWDM